MHDLCVGDQTGRSRPTTYNNCTRWDTQHERSTLPRLLRILIEGEPQQPWQEQRSNAECFSSVVRTTKVPEIRDNAEMYMLDSRMIVQQGQ